MSESLFFLSIKIYLPSFYLLIFLKIAVWVVLLFFLGQPMDFIIKLERATYFCLLINSFWTSVVNPYYFSTWGTIAIVYFFIKVRSTRRGYGFFSARKAYSDEILALWVISSFSFLKSTPLYLSHYLACCFYYFKLMYFSFFVFKILFSSVRLNLGDLNF